MLNFIKKTFGSPDNFIYAIACQTYFSGGVTEGESVEKIIADCRVSISDQIDETGTTNEAGRIQWIKTAEDWGLEGGFCSYEGGPDHGGGETVNITNRIMAERNDEMAAILTYNYDTAFFQMGGNLAVHFTLSSAYTRYGCWGLTDDITKPDRNSKYMAVQLLAEKYSSSIHTHKKHDHRIQTLFLTTTANRNALKISYFLSQPSEVIMTLYTTKGQHVVQSSVTQKAAGYHSMVFPNRLIGTGTQYLFVSVQAGCIINRRGCVLIW
jgi:hypothetical protein